MWDNIQALFCFEFLLQPNSNVFKISLIHSSTHLSNSYSIIAMFQITTCLTCDVHLVKYKVKT